MPGQNPKKPHEVHHVKTAAETRRILASLKKADRCSDDCPGWGIFNEHEGRPEIQVCDECMTSLPKHVRLSDDDVAQLAEARRALKAAEARVLEDDYEENPRSTFTAKGERMYQDIKRGYRGDPRAAEIAARTVYARAREGVAGLVKKR